MVFFLVRSIGRAGNGKEFVSDSHGPESVSSGGGGSHVFGVGDVGVVGKDLPGGKLEGFYGLDGGGSACGDAFLRVFEVEVATSYVEEGSEFEPGDSCFLGSVVNVLDLEE